MPRYFIDLHDGTQPLRDEVGFDLPDLPAARAKVVRIMSAIARDMLPDVDRQDYVAGLRDGAGKVLYRVRLSLRRRCSKAEARSTTPRLTGAAASPSPFP